MHQMKEQEKSLEKEPNETKASKLPGTELKTGFKEVQKISEKFYSTKKDTETIKKTNKK